MPVTKTRKVLGRMTMATLLAATPVIPAKHFSVEGKNSSLDYSGQILTDAPTTEV